MNLLFVILLGLLAPLAVLSQQLTVTTVSYLTTIGTSETVFTTGLTLTVTDNGNCLMNTKGQCITYNVGCTLPADFDYRCIYGTAVVSSSSSSVSGTATATQTATARPPSTTTTVATIKPTSTTIESDVNAIFGSALLLAGLSMLLL